MESSSSNYMEMKHFSGSLLSFFGREFLSVLWFSLKMSFGLGFSRVYEDWGWLLSSQIFLFPFFSGCLSCLNHLTCFFPQSIVLSPDRRVPHSSCVLSSASFLDFSWPFSFFIQVSLMLGKGSWSALPWYFPISRNVSISFEHKFSSWHFHRTE